MPPTELDGEAADRRTHGPPDRCLLQQLRAAAGAFFRAARSHAGDEAAPDQVQRIARFGTGGQCARPRTGRASGGVCRQRHAAGRRADRDGLRRASVREFRSSAWRRPRDPPRRGLGPQRRAARCPIEGRGQNAVLAARRRPRRAGAGPARISRQRSDACARNSDHTGAGGRLDRRTCLSRPPVARSCADPRRIQPHPRRDLPIFRRARRPRSHRTSFRLRH